MIFPIGVLLYWVTTNVWSMGQQAYVIRRMPPPLLDGPSAGPKSVPAPDKVDLAKRGEDLVARIRKQEATKATVKSAKTTTAKAKTTKTQAAKTTKTVATDAKATAKKAATTAKKSSAPASAKTTATAAKATANDAASAVVDGAEKVGN